MPSGADMALRVRGPELFAADRRVLTSFASAAAGALRGRRVAQRAAEAAATGGRGPDAGHACWPAWGTTCVPRWPSIKAAVSSLRQDDVAWTPGETAELLETIETGADRLQSLVGNLLDASRLQAGAVTTLTERVRLEEIVVGRCWPSAGSTTCGRDDPRRPAGCHANLGLAERVPGRPGAELIPSRWWWGHVCGLKLPTACTLAVDVVDTGPGSLRPSGSAVEPLHEGGNADGPGRARRTRGGAGPRAAWPSPR